jgi:hypothetical protein
MKLRVDENGRLDITSENEREKSIFETDDFRITITDFIRKNNLIASNENLSIIENKIHELLRTMDRFLQPGDVFLLENGMTVYYQDREATLGLKQHYLTSNIQTVEVDGELYEKINKMKLEIPTPPEGEYIVLSTELTGGGHGHGIHDYFPDGHKVVAKNIKSNEEISFYQSVNFTASIMPEEITFVRSEYIVNNAVMQVSNLEKLIELLEEENESAMALLINCVKHNRIDLADNVAGIVLKVKEEKHMSDQVHEEYLTVYKELKSLDKAVP